MAGTDVVCFLVVFLVAGVFFVAVVVFIRVQSFVGVHSKDASGLP